VGVQMGIIKVILFFVAFWVVWRLVKRMQLNKISFKPGEQKNASVQSVIKCKYCGVHVVQGEALVRDDHFFCCKEH